MRVGVIQQDQDHFYIADMPGGDLKHPGELNPNAPLTAELCMDYNLSGVYRIGQLFDVVVLKK